MQEERAKALLPARQRLGLEPQEGQKRLPAVGPTVSEEIEWGETGVQSVESNAVSGLAQQQVDALSDEERDLLSLVSAL